VTYCAKNRIRSKISNQQREESIETDEKCAFSQEAEKFRVSAKKLLNDEEGLKESQMIMDL
jgi:hypothetical protein